MISLSPAGGCYDCETNELGCARFPGTIRRPGPWLAVMTIARPTAIAAALLLAACGTAPDGADIANNAPNQPVQTRPPADAATPPAPTEAAPEPATQTPAQSSQRPLSEAERALDAARRFTTALSDQRFVDAYAMWKAGGSSPRPGESEFAAKFAAFRSLLARPELPDRVEGAAGSLYAEVPVTLTGETIGGEAFKRTGTITLKRVNDVPGATPEQLRWHIIDVKL